MEKHAVEIAAQLGSPTAATPTQQSQEAARAACNIADMRRALIVLQAKTKQRSFLSGTFPWITRRLVRLRIWERGGETKPPVLPSRRAKRDFQ